ncbi:NADPH-dependent FMN reductase [Dyadobacter sediminis]|uniref:NAD(P)H-dependent oxidoreductase n=1 Tax=Dyadobacter sediminis TaxID=1493691 RepID=A0A5R9KJU5_9BACT|nr:NAD(P)H-dependent oxidoreductase [Dyadobacter sediminis]TLU96472.1 NAD(P)H-dependent oxidoreductase [Dyadobacter sediminis]GGB82486.1 FMN reductase [Dyadobacter sediminis]
MYKLKVISSTVRPGRKGPLVAAWILEVARQHGSFEVELLDLGQLDLPMMNEPNHPAMRKYEHEHTKKWSATIDEADAFIFVTAEYNFNYPAPLRNALEYLVQEWHFKAAGIVSYGGVSAGTRAANSLKGDLATLKMVPLTEAVNFPFFINNINEQGEFVANETSVKAAKTMLDGIARWTKGLQGIRENQ